MGEAVEVDYEAFRREVEALQRALAEMPEIAKGELDGAFQQGLMVLQGAAADYPAAPEGSRYRRTGTLGRLWVSGARVVGPGPAGVLLEGRISNAVPYGPLVQDPQLQMKIHRGRWKTTEKILEENQGAIQGLMDRAGVRLVEKVAEKAER